MSVANGVYLNDTLISLNFFSFLIFTSNHFSELLVAIHIYMYNNADVLKYVSTSL